jgi:ABC-type uncharacterized transport system substrate-binding protein
MAGKDVNDNNYRNAGGWGGIASTEHCVLAKRLAPNVHKITIRTQPKRNTSSTVENASRHLDNFNRQFGDNSKEALKGLNYRNYEEKY